MAAFLEIPDLDMIFQSVVAPIIVNDIPYVTEQDKENFNAIIMTRYETDVLTNTPSCACGKYQYGYMVGKECDHCHTQVVFPSEEAIDLRTWIRVPDGFKGFILPLAWVQLSKMLSPRGYNIMEWITNSQSRPPRQLPKETRRRIEYFENIHWPRGLNNLIDNFDQFLDHVAILTRKTKECNYLRSVKDRVFPQHLSVPTKAMLILEITQVGMFADNASISGAINAARTIAHLCAPRIRPWSLGQVEAKIVSVITHLTNYYVTTVKDSICSRKGWLRGQLFRSRSHFCARGVITSISAPHDYEELHIPWAQGLELFKIHIIAKLMRRGFTQMEAYTLVESSGNVYDPLLDEIIQELIDGGYEIEKITGFFNPQVLALQERIAGKKSKPRAEVKAWPRAGPAGGFQRNPSLHRLSCQTFYITKVKTDLTDKTFSFSVLDVKGPNADRKIALKSRVLV